MRFCSSAAVGGRDAFFLLSLVMVSCSTGLPLLVNHAGMTLRERTIKGESVSVLSPDPGDESERWARREGKRPGRITKKKSTRGLVSE